MNLTYTRSCIHMYNHNYKHQNILDISLSDNYAYILEKYNVYKSNITKCNIDKDNGNLYNCQYIYDKFNFYPISIKVENNFIFIISYYNLYSIV